MQFLEVSGISLQEGGNPALQDISFQLREFRRLVIAGETGSGKSTLLQTIAGLAQPDAGQVRFLGKKVKGPADVLVPGHEGIAYLSQQFELPPFLRVEQILRYADTLPEGEAANLYRLCRIEHLLPRKTNQLSGGERQRIAMARLLLSSPRLFLLDEPFSNLDMAHKNLLKSVIHDLGRELGITFILVSHDPLDTLSWAQEIMVLRGGRLIQRGTPEEIYRQPADAYTASLFGGFNLVPARQVAGFRQWLNLPATGKDLLIRPENFIIRATESAETRPGKVLQVLFFGAYYELEIRFLKTRIRVKTSRGDFRKGDTVQVALAPTDVWWV